MMIEKRKGFTLVELIVVLVIIGILLAMVIPNLTGWIDRAKDKRMTAQCRQCVVAAQTLAIEAYSRAGTVTTLEGAAVIELAGIKEGSVSNIGLDATNAAVNTLTYSKGAESVTYYRLPSPRYVVGAGIDAEMAAAYNWAKGYTYKQNRLAHEYLTIDYGYEDHSPLNDAQKKLIFGDLELEKETQYIYPMAIYDTAGKLLNIRYVTPQNPKDAGSQNRYQAAAFIIDGKTYISQNRPDGPVKGHVNAAQGSGNSFQNIMNHSTFTSTQEFVDLITGSGYFEEVK